MNGRVQLFSFLVLSFCSCSAFLSFRFQHVKVLVHETIFLQLSAQRRCQTSCGETALITSLFTTCGMKYALHVAGKKLRLVFYFFLKRVACNHSLWKRPTKAYSIKIKKKLSFVRTCGCSVFTEDLHQQCLLCIQVGFSRMPLSRCERLLNCAEPSLRK